mgnify:CR=1 FL=1|tara:strand:+ start:16129 stop:17388 length:1260 start_codon:yes stop_codon:yes gene_type:complete
MAADATLVQGARDASKYYGGPVDKARKELFNNLNKQIANSAKKKEVAQQKQQAEQAKMQKQATSEAEALEQQALIEKKRLEAKWEKETTGNANAILAADGDFSNENYGALYDNINGDLKSKFINGSPKERQMAMNELQKRTQQVDGIKQYSTDNASLLVNANGEGKPFNTDGYSSALQDEAYANEKNILGGHTAKDSFNISDDINDAGEVVGSKIGLRGSLNEETGEYEYMGAEEAMAMSDRFRVDQASQAELLTLQNTMTDLADESKHDAKFDIGSAKNKVKQIINNSDKKLSLMYDELIDGRSFKNDLMGSGMLANVTYAQLGISPEEAFEIERAAGEENPDGVIGSDALTSQDQESILRKFLTSGDMKAEREEMLTTYYTDIMSQTWHKQHSVVVEQYNAANPGAANNNVKSVDIG